ncbi:MAG: phospholipase D-like domain-containing protein [Byssovorax sp.]
MKSKIDLQEELSRNAFDHAVISTYTFEPQFFEGYCLDRWTALRENGNINILVDRNLYDEIIAGPPARWPRLANIRYLLHPIAAARTFHPKVFLFATGSKGLLIVGSANFTRSGLTNNAELVGVYRYERDRHEQHLGLFKQALAFLRDVAARWPGRDLASNLDALVGDATWLRDEEEPAGGRLIHSLEEPLWARLSGGLARPVDALHVLSRYYDRDPHLIDKVADDLAPKKIVFWTENGITTMTPDWIRHPLVRSGVASVRLCTYADEDRRQPLHAKSIIIQTGKTLRLAFGSANFTRAGMFSPASTGNVETMMLFDGLSAAQLSAEKLFDPTGTSIVVKSPDKLQAAPNDKKGRGEGMPVKLQSASLDEGRIDCECVAPPDVAARIRCLVLELGDAARVRLQVRQRSEGLWSGNPREEDLRRLDEEAAVVHLEGAPGEPLSNRVFLLNLQDYATGRGQRRERRIYEAQQGSAQFSAVLEDLLASGDIDGLVRFLNLCDIPVVDAARPLAFARPRPAWSGEDEMRRLGERNLHVCVSLHEAVVGFCERVRAPAH